VIGVFNADDEIQNHLPLPAELFGVVAEFLAGEFKLGSLANFNVVNRFIHEATSAVLWTTITLDGSAPRWNDMLKKVLSDKESCYPTPAGIKALENAMENFERRKDLPGILPENRRHVK
jgi:hypothetical protein